MEKTEDTENHYYHHTAIQNRNSNTQYQWRQDRILNSKTFNFGDYAESKGQKELEEDVPRENGFKKRNSLYFQTRMDQPIHVLFLRNTI